MKIFLPSLGAFDLIMEDFLDLTSLRMDVGSRPYILICPGDLTKLELLSISYNFLSFLPPTMPNLIFLRSVAALSTARLDKILFPRELKISGNKLKQFPLEVTFLPNLQLLDLSLNQAG